MTGAERSRYDHGVQAARRGPSAGAVRSKKRLAIKSQFDSEQPATWSYAWRGFRSRRFPRTPRAVAAGLRSGRSDWRPTDRSPAMRYARSTCRRRRGRPRSRKSPLTIRAACCSPSARLAEPGAYDFEGADARRSAGSLRYAIVDSHPGAPRIWQRRPRRIRHRDSATTPQQQWRRRHRLRLRRRPARSCLMRRVSVVHRRAVTQIRSTPRWPRGCSNRGRKMSTACKAIRSAW